MAETREHVLLSAFAALEGAHFYSAFLPSVMTIRKFAQDEEAQQALRQGEVLATSFALALGWVLSELVDSYLPLLFSIGTAVLMVGVYEYAIRGKFDATTAKNTLGMAAGNHILPFGYTPA